MNLLDQIRAAHTDTLTLRAAESADAVDGVLPQVVATPCDEASAQKFVAWCGENDVAFIARGGGTKLFVGATPARLDVLISTENLNQIYEHDEGNATIEAGAGISLDALQREVEKRGQFVPLEWKPNSGATLGGVVASNHFGALKARYGAPRDLVVGMHIALSDGRVVQAGSKVVKNVSGYDLNKLFVGSFGTLGLITRVTLRLRPQDAMRREWSSTLASWEEAQNAARELCEGAFEPASVRVIADGSTLRVSARFDGSQAAVESQLARLPQSTASEETIEQQTEYSAPALQLRAHLPLTRAAHWAQQAQARGARRVLWDCALGVVRAEFETLPAKAGDVVQQLRSAAEAADGFVVVLRAPHELKTPDFVWGEKRGDAVLQQKVKATYDPKNVCAPGRFMGA